MTGTEIRTTDVSVDEQDQVEVTSGMAGMQATQQFIHFTTH